MMLLNSFCGGLSLAQGTIAAGIYSMMRAAIFTVLGIRYLKCNSDPKENFLIYTTDDTILMLPHSNRYQLIGMGYIVDAVIILIVSVFLFVGVKTNHATYLLPWLTIHGIAALMSVPNILYHVTLCDMSLAFLIIRLFFSTLMIYLFIVVLSYFKSLRALTANQEMTGNVESGNAVETRPVVSGEQMPGLYMHLPPKDYIYSQPPPYKASFSPPQYANVV